MTTTTKTKTKSFITKQVEKAAELRKTHGYIILYALVGEYLLKYYGEDNLIAMRQGSKSKQDAIARKVVNVFDDLMINIHDFPERDEEAYFAKNSLKLIPVGVEKRIRLYLDQIVKEDLEKTLRSN